MVKLPGVITGESVLQAQERTDEGRRGEAPTAKQPRLARTAVSTLVGIAIVLPVCFSLLTFLLPLGHDTLEYLPRQVEFDRNISEGILFPQWVPDLLLGNGEPLFEFNPPMIYYLAEFWHLLGCNFIVALNLASVLLVVASAGGMFLLGRLYFGSAGGCLAAAAYLYSPYFAVNLYVRGALAEFAAFAFYPFALYGFAAYARRRNRGYLVLGALAYAGVLLSHNPAALFFTPLLIGFLLLTAYKERSWSVLRNQIAGWILGLGVGACVWLPSLAESRYISLQRLLEGPLRYSNHFVYWHQFLYSRWGYGISVPGDHDEISFSLGWSHLLLIMLAVVLIVKLRKSVGWSLPAFFAGATAIYCISMTPWAEPVWDRIPFLQLVEFPWRMLGPASVCVAMLIAPLGGLAHRFGTTGKALIVVALALLFLPNLSHNRPEKYQAVSLARWTPEALLESGYEPATAHEYAPRAVERLLYVPGGLRRISGDATLQSMTRSVTSWSGEIRATVPSVVEAAITWFPGWTVVLDNHQVEARAGEPAGLVRFDVPPGTHQVAIRLKRTLPRMAGQLLSWASILLLALIAAWEMH